MAATINEEKRQREEIMQLQKSLEGWEGRDITDTSTQLIHEGSLLKVSCVLLCVCEVEMHLN